MVEELKILVAGDVEGKFKKLFSRVEAINKKSGPFDYLLCVGNFFGNDDELFSYVSGENTVTVPTYILGPNNNETIKYYPELNGCELAPNLTYLGKRGIFSTNNGLVIAYVSGVDDREVDDVCRITEEDWDRVRNGCIKGQISSFRGIDILITSSWPANVTKGDECITVDSILNESKFISRLAYDIKPRYHFFGLSKKHYERKPYKNGRTQFGSHLTRAISLAEVGNARKEKWLYAMTLIPIKFMKASALNMLTTDTTECPYDFNTTEKTQQFFYDMNYKGDRGEKRKNKNRGQSLPNKVMNVKNEDCWFCLANPKFEKHLVISIGEEAYLTLPKGGLVWDHCMILPITHYKNYSDMPTSLREEINKFKLALTELYALQKKIPVFFDRNFRTPHFQLHVVPVPSNLIEPTIQLFTMRSESKNMTLTEIPENAEYDDILGIHGDYFYIEIGKNRFIHTIQRYFPLQFAREILAHKVILNVPDRVDWKACEVSQEEELENAKKFKSVFEKFDFTI